MGNLAQSDWASDPCPGRHRHPPCGETNWECKCPDYYVRRGPRKQVLVQEAELFARQGGLSQPWGKSWSPVRAKNIHEAREIGHERFRNLYWRE